MKTPQAGSAAGQPEGFVSIGGERYYRIAGYHLMPPFLMNIASDTDLWMFISSSGGLTAGRSDADGAIFPYETVDRLHDGHYHTGPLTIIRVSRGGGGEILWEPFSRSSLEDFDIERNLYKNVPGNMVVFEEINHDLGLSFMYRWAGCDRFGHVRTAYLENMGGASVSLSLLDGLRNILPFGAPLALYEHASTLVDAYKRTDCDPASGIGVFSLTSRIIDRAEAAEELRANTAWCSAWSDFTVSLSIESAGVFRSGGPVGEESVLTGRRGNYLVTMKADLEPGEREKWHICADAGLGHLELADLREMISKGGDVDVEIEAALSEAGSNIRRIVGSADGIQLGGIEKASAHHFANVLFNNMRGGVFASNYDIGSADLRDFISVRNREVSDRNAGMLASLPETIRCEDLCGLAESSGDPGLQRLCYEYLPIYFGRRHGDPSRPWNRFAIRVKDRGGRRLLGYEGNWRDIFQNWEALSNSFPGFLPGMAAKFVNASTVDGFNPYRLTREGVEWEVADPDDPWSYIGYWGDHQIIYLLKFLEWMKRFYPGRIEDLMVREIFSYADVPYRIKPYKMIREDPYSTIVYNAKLAERIDGRVASSGTDGRLVHGADGSVYHVTLLEKLLVPVLAKLSNLVPDGGIWMNTQRPEWNDANNALVGNGISMVTLFYLRRHLDFLAGVLEGVEETDAAVSAEVADWFEGLCSIFDGEKWLLEKPEIDDGERMRVIGLLGEAFSDYRDKVYSRGFSGKRMIGTCRTAGFCRTAIEWLDHAIRANRRQDGLYHSYNLLEISKGGREAAVDRLYGMLEGQVAALSSGAIGPEEALELLKALFDSDMYREDQRSFMLYPERALPAFMDKNAVPARKVLAIPLLREMAEEGDGTIISIDSGGVYRFNREFANASDVTAALDALASCERWKNGAESDGGDVLDLFEEVFRHKEFTGRSGTMYKYEGLGCIYWHMVSKLLLAVQEAVFAAEARDDADRVLGDLIDMYYDVRSGLSFEKTACEYGAFPTDPYSHTPPRGGAQQPGMTGQVKEEILTRLGELGVTVEDGILSFRPVLLKEREFLQEEQSFDFCDLGGSRRSMRIPAGSLAFTFCQVPVIYELTGGDRRIRVYAADGSSAAIDGSSLDADMSRAVFDRLGTISRIEVRIPRVDIK